MELGTIAVIGSHSMTAMMMQAHPIYSSSLIKLNPFEGFSREQVSGRYFSGVIVLPGATEGVYFDELYSIVKSRLKIN